MKEFFVRIKNWAKVIVRGVTLVNPLFPFYISIITHYTNTFWYLCHYFI